MDKVTYQRCINFMDELMDHPCAKFFAQSFHEERRLFPKYSKIIARPMNLSIVYEKLLENNYKTFTNLWTDIKLLQRNTKEYFVDFPTFIEVCDETIKLAERLARKHFLFSNNKFNNWSTILLQRQFKLFQLLQEPPHYNFPIDLEQPLVPQLCTENELEIFKSNANKLNDIDKNLLYQNMIKDQPEISTYDPQLNLDIIDIRPDIIKKMNPLIESAKKK